ncbi:AtpZ/AtpI family protein [Acetobacterium sp.]|uniref:AtpZ/AtpI family protein n=1 Tax=Acetobacterium sp. TaxID=1872094 RepID=UPI002719E00A|nr:AtpZ/AtpI family protein [Acetobacterium sp.]MDO9494026.1 AtpZ/AtpI family protein [Acetobacterium sp.]
MDNEKNSPEKKIEKKIQSDVEKKIKAKAEQDDIMFGLGVFGIIGWSISIPTLLGIFLGIYLDDTFSMGFSWTLTLLFVGVIVGCLNAWYWIKQKSDSDKD